jgi:hypothetical protein
MMEVMMSLMVYRLIVLVLVLLVGFISWKWLMMRNRIAYASRVLGLTLIGTKDEPDSPAYEKICNLYHMIDGKKGTGIVDGIRIMAMPLDDVLVLAKKAPKTDDRSKADAKLIQKLAKREVKLRLKRKK